MARNRKRRTAGRTRRPSDGSATQPGVATARGSRPEDAAPSPENGAPPPADAGLPENGAPLPDGAAGLPDDAPDPLEHAAPDVELAEAQLALGRPRYAASDPAAADADLDAGDGGEEDDLDLDEGGSGGGRGGPSTAVSAPRPNAPTRLVHFLQGSWRELQRVQWPDRRQVMQATGVVVGFVIVAGVFLGVADLIASKVVKLILP